MEVAPLIGKIILALFCAYIALRLAIKAIASLTSNGHIDEPYDSIFNAVIKWLLVIITFLVILQLFGIPISHVFATLSAVLVLVAVGFVAVWSVLSNILCAFLLLLS